MCLMFSTEMWLSSGDAVMWACRSRWLSLTVVPGWPFTI
jgi:hypothetical protein